ncbi:MAG: hypothetical protein WCS69_08120 [Ignavibacteriaceae bacterium]|jgi:hypothetical protein
MKEKYNNYYRMLLAVEKALLANAPITGLRPALVRAVTRLSGKIAEIQEAEKARGGRATGLSSSKNQAEENLISIILHVASGIKSYASENKLTDLFKSVEFKHWELVKLKDNELVTKAGNIKALAADKLSELADFGVVEADLTLLDTLAADFKNYIGNIGMVRGGKTVETKNVGVLFDEAKVILEDQIDGLVETLKAEHSEFYNQYYAVREVLNLGGSHGKDEEDTPPPPDTPTPPAQ